MNDFISKVIEKHLSPASVTSFKSIAGGCINNAFKVTTTGGTYFLKWNKPSLYEMFKTESTGLTLLDKLSPISSPHVFGLGKIDEKSYLLTSWIEKGIPESGFWENFGKSLAIQHKESSRLFGLDHNNFIGSLKQSNRQHTKWTDFFINERLTPQINLASSSNLIDTSIQSKFDKLFQKLENLIPTEKPSFLHGDLWSGNFIISDEGKAAIYDPAVHYGHRETELAFTHLFGGFSPDFYKYYNEEYPIEPGFDDRIEIHNLYPLLVHVNLFGNSYLTGIIQTLNRFT
ncbi:fructosamine kinase family protein [Ekhidna sp.]|uniref:fructosamine kinase family protein n=1 Tax=Ekhidna sp. TaxID=2608089 RepID=UPI003297BCF1